MSLVQHLEPLLIQALVPELAVEALDVAVLHGAARLDEDVQDAMRAGPGHEGPAGGLRAVVGAHRMRVPYSSLASILTVVSASWVMYLSPP